MKARRRFFVSAVALCAVTGAGSIGLGADKEESDRTSLKRCFEAWGKTPFGSAETAPFTTISASVKVMGIGRDIIDEQATSEPKLILIKPSVNVMTKTAYKLMNPNGWYCIKSSVTVLGKAEITLHCKAHLGSGHDGVAVAGSNDGAKGVTVLGKAVVKREGCDK